MAPFENLLPRPPYDVEIAAALPPFPDLPEIMDEAALEALRAEINTMFMPMKAAVLANPAVIIIDRTIPGPHGPIEISIFKPKELKKAANAGKQPGIYHIHGGGMYSGDRFLGMGGCAKYVEEFDAVAISVEYRLAPEHAHPVPVEDCYAGLKWVGENLKELGIDPERLIIAGESAGGGLAAAVALMARDKGGPKLLAQMLIYPMLDDRNDSISCRQFSRGDTWNRQINRYGWECLLGNKAGGEYVSYYAAPARCTDLSGLPQAFIDVGSAEPFRDEDVAYASKLWACGTQAELHVWPGGIHGSDGLVPSAAISKAAVKTRTEWMRRVLSN